MNKAQASAIVGGLSRPSKMPGKSIGLPALECNVGRNLRKIPGSTCQDCYALKGMYRFPTVQTAQYRRLDALDHPEWTNSMVVLLQGERYFRWHDSGDIQDIDHLLRIVDVCEQTPNTMHWLPTREKAIVKKYLRAVGKFPDNLNVRISDTMVDAGKRERIPGTTSSGVTSNGSHNCPAPNQDNACGNCRDCWNASISHINYHKH